MKHSRIFLLTAIAAMTLTATSCRKKTEEPEIPVKVEEDTEQASAADNNLAENYAAEIESMGSQASENGTLTTFKTSGDMQTAGLEMAPCATVSTVPGTAIYTVDFGTNCTCADGRVRSGKLIYDYSASPSTAKFYRNPGFSMKVSSQNFIVDGNSVTITNKSVTNTTPLNLPGGMNPGTNLTWSISASITITKANNGGVITWSCNRTKELLNTNDTNCYRGQSISIHWKKAVVKLNGSASGSRPGGETFTVTSTDLVRDFSCAPDSQHPHWHPFKSGTTTITPGSRHARTIDFGSGVCDNQATLTIKGKSFPFALR